MYSNELYFKQFNIKIPIKYINRFLFNLTKNDFSKMQIYCFFVGWKENNINIRMYGKSNSIIPFIKNFRRKDVEKIHGRDYRNCGFIIRIDNQDLSEYKVAFEAAPNKLINPIVNPVLSCYLTSFIFNYQNNKQEHFLHVDKAFIAPRFSLKQLNEIVYFTFFVVFQRMFIQLLKNNTAGIDSTSLDALSKKYPWERIDDTHYLERTLYINGEELDNVNYRKVKSESLALRNDKELQNVQILKSMMLVDEDLIYIPDESWSFNYEWISGIYPYTIFNSDDKDGAVFVNDKYVEKIELEKALFCFSKDSNNFWHFLFDIAIPLNVMGDNQNFDYLLALKKSTNPKFLNFIKYITNRDIVLLDPNFKYNVKRVIPLTPVLTITDEPESKFSNCSLDKRAINLFKNFIFSSFINNKLDHYQKICFVRTSSSRRIILNRRIIFILLQFFRYKIIDPDSFSIQDQISLASGAKSFIIFGGAAAAHAIFASENAEVRIISSDVNEDFSGYKVFEELSSGNMKVVPMGRPKYSWRQILKGHRPNRLDPIHLSYRVRVIQFIRLLIKLR